MLNIRLATEQDRDGIWNIFHAVIAQGDTYAFDPKMSREEALAYWFRPDTRTYVAEQDRQIVGTYILKANQPASALTSLMPPLWSRKTRADWE